MRAGPMRHRLKLQTQQRVKNNTGGFNETWVDSPDKLWAEITIPTGRTAPVAEGMSVSVTAEIRTRPRADIKVGCRLVGKHTTYLIGAALPDNDLSMLRLLCSNVPNP